MLLNAGVMATKCKEAEYDNESTGQTLACAIASWPWQAAPEAVCLVSSSGAMASDQMSAAAPRNCFQ